MRPLPNLRVTGRIFCRGGRPFSSAPGAVSVVVPVPGAPSVLLEVRQFKELYATGALGAVLWPASHALIRFLSSADGRALVQGANVVELGAGCGVVGMAASVLGASQVVMTDVATPKARVTYDVEGAPSEEEEEWTSGATQLDVLRLNAKLNADRLGDIRVEALRWGNLGDVAACLKDFSDGRTDLVLGSDVTYSTQSHQSLFSTARALLTASGAHPGPKGRLILSHHVRARFSYDNMIESAERAGFLWRVVFEIEESASGNAFGVGISESYIRCIEFRLQEADAMP